MKKKSLTGSRMAYLKTIVLLLLLPAFACRKNETAATAPVPVQLMATTLEGEVFKGRIAVEGDDEGLALWCNGGKVLIAMGKLAASPFINPGNIEQAEVLYSNFGVIIRDVQNQKTWYYIQNDTQSRQRFESLQHNTGTTLVSEIEGTFRLNIS